MSAVPLNAVARFEVVCRDLNTSAAFYHALFGWRVSTNNAVNYGFIDTGTDRELKGGFCPDHDTPPRVVIYVQVADAEEAVERAIRLGATLVFPVTKIPGRVRFAQVADPDGNAIGLIEGTW